MPSSYFALRYSFEHIRLLGIVGYRIEARRKSRERPSSGRVEGTSALLGFEVVVDSVVAAGKSHSFETEDFGRRTEFLVGRGYRGEVEKGAKV